MMQTAGALEGDHMDRSAGPENSRAPCWCVLLKEVMDSIHVIIENIITDQTAQMSFVDDDHVI